MKNEKNMLVLVLFLLGIFMGSIDNGIVAPAREIIENSFGVERSLGIWMITIYTLFFAVSMPIVSKMSDRYGHKNVYTFAIMLFGLGSLLCGLTNFFGNFSLFLAARVIQAIGAGGIIPISNTVIGLSFPEEKRGTALGLIGAVFGIGTILGPSLGSSILNFAGNDNWGWLFFINVPITLVIIILSFTMKNTKKEIFQPVDLAGTVVFAAAIGSLIYGLTNIDFFQFVESIRNTNVYPFLLIFAVLLPILLWIESRAKDPVLNLKYFKNRQILVIFILALIVGIGMSGMFFVPQFSENILKIKAGSGGYLTTILAVFSGISAPLSGKLLDEKGARFVMILGFFFTIAGAVYLGYVASEYQYFINILVGLALMGFGVGFTIGAPLNYLVLQSVPDNEGATALATMSLMRSTGLAVSPGIMVGFVVSAAKNLPANLQNAGVPMPSGTSEGSSDSKVFESLQTADVTNIVDRIKDAAVQLAPEKLHDMILANLEGMRSSIENTFQATLNTGYRHMFTAVAIISAVALVTTLLLRKDGYKGVDKIDTSS